MKNNEKVEGGAINIDELFERYEVSEVLVKSAKNKGFKPRTVSTKWVEQRYIGKKINAFLNDNCYISYLEEIKTWLRINFNFHVFTFLFEIVY